MRSGRLTEPPINIRNVDFNDNDPLSGNIDLYTQREAVSGKYIQTKKVNKLSNYYMDILLKHKMQEVENRAEKVMSEQRLLDKGGLSPGPLPSIHIQQEMSKVSSLAQIAQRHQSFDTARSTEDKAIKESYLDDAYDNQTRRSRGPNAN